MRRILTAHTYSGAVSRLRSATTSIPQTAQTTARNGEDWEMLARRTTTAAVVTLAAVALVLVIAFQALGGVQFTARIDDGVKPRLSSEDVRAIVEGDLDSMASAVGRSAGGSAEAIAITLDQLDRFIVDPPVMSEGGWDDSLVVWVVRAHSTFVTFRGRSTEPRSADSGWLLIDDASGEIMAMGFPLKTP